MKIVTANRLSDGAVVYLDKNGGWTHAPAAAAVFVGEKADDALAEVTARAGEIADAYLVDIDEAGALAGRTRLRETIRGAGPTVRLDLGYQSEAR